MKLQTNPAAGLLQDELEVREIAAAKAARDMSIPRSRLSDIFAGRKGVSADTALRFQRYLGIPAELLVKLQAEFDLSRALDEKGAAIRRQVQPVDEKAIV
jgi:addiction module HigA family antidote